VGWQTRYEDRDVLLRLPGSFCTSDSPTNFVNTARVHSVFSTERSSSGTLYLQRERRNGPVTSWRLSLSGGQPSAIRAGQVIKTTDRAHGVMESQSVGQIHIDPGSQIRLVSARDSEQRLALDHGAIHALIRAPPTRFVVETPSACAVDLGCQYTLNVAKDGTGQLTVEFGWVAFQWHKMESFIPAGAACATRRFRGPGTPHSSMLQQILPRS
jgi:FecR protein